ncbi:hypothetical protein PIB30_092840 [Stylosanthes scabra]|uniref:Uncharacterized protein n=1 Tax=Stylosanthes scabra TaxID=79078 RepID=A0ABU6UWR6_9FABA|nr:hypothetical protein [Stylosanthes scabra]
MCLLPAELPADLGGDVTGGIRVEITGKFSSPCLGAKTLPADFPFDSNSSVGHRPLPLPPPTPIRGLPVSRLTYVVPQRGEPPWPLQHRRAVSNPSSSPSLLGGSLLVSRVAAYIPLTILTVPPSVLTELCCFLYCLAYLGASLLVMIEDFAMIWHNLIEKSVFVAVLLDIWDFLSKSPTHMRFFNDATASDSQIINLALRDHGAVFEGLESIVDVVV